MGIRFRKAAQVFVVGPNVLFAAAHLVRPARSNPPIDASRTLQTHTGSTSELDSLHKP